MDAAEPERSRDNQAQAARRANSDMRVKYTSDTFREYRTKLLSGKPITNRVWRRGARSAMMAG